MENNNLNEEQALKLILQLAQQAQIKAADSIVVAQAITIVKTIIWKGMQNENQ